MACLELQVNCSISDWGSITLPTCNSYLTQRPLTNITQQTAQPNYCGLTLHPTASDFMCEFVYCFSYFCAHKLYRCSSHSAFVHLTQSSIEILMYLGVTGVTTYLFWPINQTASKLLFPLLGWATLASSLNIGVWLKNKDKDA